MVTDDGTSHGNAAMYTCDEGYAHLQGVTVRYCEKGKWTEEAPTCTEIKNGMV